MRIARFNPLAICICLMFCILGFERFAISQDFSIVVLPDTQNEIELFPQTFNSQMQWIVENRQVRNIQFVLSEGDNVNDTGSAAQMQQLDSGFRMLDNAGIPYLLGIGNHDYDFADPKGRGLTGFNQWFGPGRYADKTFFKGNFPVGSNANSYAVVSFNGKPFLLMSVEFRPTSASLAWMEAILSANADKEAILVVHSFVFPTGKREELCDTQDMAPGNANGQEVWERLRKHSNVVMVVGGHFTNGPAARRVDLGDSGNLVNQMYADYQDFSNGGNGWLRILTFHSASNTISVETYSPFLKQFKLDAQNQFTLAYRNPLPQTGIGSLSGKVRQQLNCLVVPGIKVSAGTASTTSAADGTYRLAVPPGNYTITATGLGWSTITKAEKVSDNLDTQQHFYLTPSATPGLCTPSTISPSVTICSPANNATVVSPVSVSAMTTDNKLVSFVQAYVDGASVVTQNGNSLRAQVVMSLGSHRLTVQAKDSSGVLFKQTVNITVTTGLPAGACIPGNVSPSVTICSPLDGAVVNSPVHILVATRAADAVSFITIYLDGSPVLTRTGSTLDTTITLAKGIHRLTAQAKDAAGLTFKRTVYITVQ